MNGTILICEDEQDLVAMLEYNLRREGFDVRVASSGQQALTLVTAEPRPILVLLDLMLPDLSGVEICRRLRADPTTATLPIIMLTALTEEVHRVVGFEVGADDYITKPFSVRELLLRIQALLRRTSPPQDATGDAAMTFGRLRLDPHAHQATIDGESLALSALEFRLLGILVTRPGRALSREMLKTEVWGATHHVTLRAIDTHMKRLRQKLGDAGDYIETIRGVGYRLRGAS